MRCDPFKVQVHWSTIFMAFPANKHVLQEPILGDSWSLVIPGKRPPRPGEGHWSKVHKSKAQWTEYLGWLALSKRIPKAAPGERRRIEIVFERPGPISDKDNAYATCKVPLDALKRCGLIEDDSPRCIDLHAATRTAPDSRTLLRITRIP